MLTADEDITTELDRVVCRLMKLALRTSRGRQNPPPTRWLQYKLLDLLTLTEKTIDRRKRHFIETYSLKAINYDVEDKSEKIIALERMRGDDTVNKIVDRYRHLVQPTCTVLNKNLEDLPRRNYAYPDMELKDDSSVASTELLKEYEYVDRQSPGIIDPELILNENAYESDLIDQEEIKFDRVRNWVEEDNIEVVPYPNHSITFDNSSGDTDHSTGFVAQVKCNKLYKRFKSDSTQDVNDSSVHKTCKRKLTNDKSIVNHGENNTKKMKFNKINNKKVTQKKSNSNNFLRNSKHFDQTSKMPKGRSTPSNPIPKSLIELCHPELSGDKYYDNYQTPVIVNSNQTNKNNTEVHNVSATEESYLIAIVMEDMEETVALRRTIATDTSSEPIQLEYETLVQCINHDTRYKFCEEHEPATENVESQTIFLTDINEPSTSKGIRHITMDVQCGSDNIAQTYPMLSATTSYTKMSKLTDIGVKIEDLFTDVKSKSTEFGTCTDDAYIHRIISPNTKSIGIRIRDSDQILLESGIVTQEVKDAETFAPVLQNLASNETKLLKAVSSNLKIEDSCSEFCSSNGSLLKNPLHYIDSNDPNEVQINLCLSREVPVSHKLSSTKYFKPMLCCGGVHIHSYKDKTLSEDVVYQGEWQRYRPKNLIKKRSLSSLILNRVTHPLLKRNDVIKIKQTTMASNNKEINYAIGKHIQSRNNPKPTMYKPRQNSKTLKNEKIVSINKSPKLATVINIKKIASKHAVGAHIKSNYTPRKPLVLSSVGVKKDTNVQQQRPLLKNYIPKYLRKREIKLCTSIAKNLNETIDMIGTRKKVNKEKMPINLPLSLKSETKDIKSDLLKFHPIPTERMNYLVFRNEIDSKNSVSNEEFAKPEENITNKNNTNNRPHSPQSQNSSTCSSPNSIATIRFVSKKPKSVSARKNTASSQKSNIDDSGSETPTPSRLKKFTKRVNSCKSTKNSDNKNFDNKENLSEKNNLNSTKGNKIDKNVFKGSQKNVFIAQLNTENQSLQSTLTSLSKYKPQYSNFKFPSENNVDVIKNKSQSPSDSNKRLLKSESILDVGNNNNNLENSSTNEKESLLIENQLNISNQEIIVTKNTVESNLSCCIESNSDTTDNYNDIRNAMKQLLEEILNLFLITYHNQANNESETLPSQINISSDNQNSLTASLRTIPTSNNKVNSTLDIALGNDLNDSFNTTLRDISLLSMTDTNVTVTDLDLLSFKSITSETKLSESYFDGCDFSGLSTKSNSVREILEKKEEPLIKKIPGDTLASQAFSGFSVNTEPFVGDQPDHINYVDSETGSLAFEIARQATSEELFVSGRSSDSYESCVIDEDAVVPNWLFNIISQQQSVTEEPDSLNLVVPMPLEDPLPLADPAFDTNGNTEDPGIGSGAGAGDGRGIHSDHSQDSSGRGTSLSSSETSSGQQSEAIIIDASAFLGQFEPIGERSTLAIPIFSIGATQPPGVGVGVTEEQVVASIRSSRGDDPRLGLFLAASDIDADVSSLNTDATDSSDN